MGHYMAEVARDTSEVLVMRPLVPQPPHMPESQLSVPKPFTICSPTAWTGSFITPVQTAAASWAIVMLLMISHYSLFSIYI
jgi:hypothetical protein